MSIALMMVAVSTFETSVSFYETTQGNVSEGNHLHTRYRENLKSHLLQSFLNYSLMIAKYTVVYVVQPEFLSNAEQFEVCSGVTLIEWFDLSNGDTF
jgi:hypothetical protein